MIAMITTTGSAESARVLLSLPSVIPNQIGGQDARAADGRTFTKIDPATGHAICEVARSTAADVALAVELARKAQPAWAAATPVKRGDVLRQIALLMREDRTRIRSVFLRDRARAARRWRIHRMVSTMARALEI